ncbi:MAG: rpoN [Anaerocolumna sp.]|jgi:RNA polymerase sigma-54 factor|nr:rpoN [Anaerocolumna sp.]
MMKYQLEMKQKQTLSHKMIQSAEILQMSAQELEAYIGEVAMENPIIDMEDWNSPLNDNDFQKKIDWLNQQEEHNRVYSRQEFEDAEERDMWEVIGESQEEDLSEYLRSQIVTRNLTKKQYEMVSYITNCLDTKGYLEVELEEIAKHFEISLEEAEQMLFLVQSLEPAGVGARDLKECLLLQLDRKQLKAPLVRIIISEYIELLAKNQISVISKKMKLPVDKILTEIEIIKSLNPKPGNSFTSRENLNYIVPDVTVVKLEGYYEILLNEYLYPNISINNYYRSMLAGEYSAETKDYVNSKIAQAEWVKKCISQRNETLLSVTKAVVDIQDAFFYGGRSLKPMRLIDVAEIIGIHESTVSRAVKGKYLQCTWGVFPMNYFFSKGIETTEENSMMAAEGVKEEIVRLVEEEDKKNPLSDQKIADILNKKGLKISRRTVAKYRNILGIKDAGGRKLFG